MILGTVFLGVAALMLYQGFTGNSSIGEIQKLLAGEAAFGGGRRNLVIEAINNPNRIGTNPEATLPPVPTFDDPKRIRGGGGGGTSTVR